MFIDRSHDREIQIHERCRISNSKQHAANYPRNPARVRACAVRQPFSQYEVLHLWQSAQPERIMEFSGLLGGACDNLISWFGDNERAVLSFLAVMMTAFGSFVVIDHKKPECHR